MADPLLDDSRSIDNASPLSRFRTRLSIRRQPSPALSGIQPYMLDGDTVFVTVEGDRPLRSKSAKSAHIHTLSTVESEEPMLPAISRYTEALTTPHTSVERESRNPDFYHHDRTKRECLVGLLLTWMGAIVCLCLGVLILFKPRHITPTILKARGAQLALLGVNVLLTLSNDTMGFIHGTVLRWALFTETRLSYNTNLRLLQKSRRCLTNGFWSNLMCAVCLVLSYAATSQLFVASDSHFAVNGIALLALAVGLVGQAVISTWCWFGMSKRILTWSSNPLNNTLACLHFGLQPQRHRCMMSVHQSKMESFPVAPQPRQKSLAQVCFRSVSPVVVFIWILTVLAFVWAAIVTYFSKQLSASDWSFSTTWNGAKLGSVDAVSFSLDNGRLSYAGQILLGLLIVAAVQAPFTMALHCVELLVGMSRDEDAWRRATLKSKDNSHGAQVETSPFMTAMNWKSIALFLSKLMVHWLLAQCLILTSASSFWLAMSYIHIFTLAFVVLGIATFATFLALWKSRGHQPAAYGHLQTLANLIDDWTLNEDGRLWWGDKAETSAGRHAGSSYNPTLLGPVRRDALYA